MKLHLPRQPLRIARNSAQNPKGNSMRKKSNTSEYLSLYQRLSVLCGATCNCKLAAWFASGCKCGGGCACGGVYGCE
jgi:hypothetical protein